MNSVLILIKRKTVTTIIFLGIGCRETRLGRNTHPLSVRDTSASQFFRGFRGFTRLFSSIQEKTLKYDSAVIVLEGFQGVFLTNGCRKNATVSLSDKNTHSLLSERLGNLFEIVIKSTRNQIVFTIVRLIWNQTNVRLVPHQSKYGKYNLISVCPNWGKIHPLCPRDERLSIYFRNLIELTH